MSRREGLEFETEIRSDTAPLNGLVAAVLEAASEVLVWKSFLGSRATRTRKCRSFSSLCSYAFRQGPGLPVRRAARVAFVISLAAAGVDEGHQALTVSRTGRIADVTIDSSGAALALVAVRRNGTAVAPS